MTSEGGPGMKAQRARFLSASAAVITVALAAGCSSSGTSASSASTSSSAKPPIVIGASLSLTGDFSADGQAFQKGYSLWVSEVNSQGGILGRQVRLDVLNDNSSPTQVVTNYQKLITVDKADLTFGPFSSLLFAQKLSNVFDVSLPVANELDPFSAWIASLPAGQRPASGAYPMANDPFAMPQVQLTQARLQTVGVKTVYSKVFPEEVSAYKAPADDVAASGAQMVVLGSTDVPTVSAFMSAFEQQHYNPTIFIAAAGPDQGAAFTNVVGTANANGVMVPNAWYPGSANPLSQAMVKAYTAKYGGSASDINADVAEAYSVGEVVDQAVTHNGSLSNAKLINYLHSGVTLQSVQGPVRFNALGENLVATAFIFQWQNGKFVQVLPANATGSVKIIYPKPHWAS